MNQLVGDHPQTGSGIGVNRANRDTVFGQFSTNSHLNAVQNGAVQNEVVQNGGMHSASNAPAGPGARLTSLAGNHDLSLGCTMQQCMVPNF